MPDNLELPSLPSDTASEQTTLGTAHWGLKGQWLQVNQRLCDIVGYTSAELMAKTCQEITHPDDAEIEQVYFQQMLAGRRSTYTTEKRFFHKSSELVWVGLTASLVRNAAGDPNFFRGVIQDIRHRKRAEASSEIRWDQSDRAFRRAIVNAPLPILIYAEDGEILELSEGWSRLTGYGADELLTLNDWVQKAYGHKSVDVLEHINQLFTLNQTIDEGEFTLRTKSGDQRVWQFSSSPLGQLPDGRRLVISMAADVTALKATERKVEQLNRDLEKRVEQRTAQLEEVNQELQAFTYTVSHDLRAPLRAMEGFAKALLEDYAPQMDSLGADYAERIVLAAIKMDGLISDLLEYSRLSSTNISIQPLNIRPIIDRVCRDLQPLLKARQAKVTIADNLPDICGNHRIVSQIFTNLLTNGMKFVEPHTPPVLSVSYEEKADRIRFWVSDNGLGIAAEHQQRIFSIFERLHSTDDYPGTGIGLAIVKRGAKKMGSEVGVESTVGQGSRFWIDFAKVSGFS